MPKKRLIVGREDFPQTQATVETHGEGTPRPREVESDENQVRGKHRHGDDKGKKVPMRDKLK